TDKDRVRSMHPTDARRLLLGHKVPFFFKNKKAREDFVQQVNPLVQAHQNDELRQWVHPMIKAADRERARQQELTSDGRRKPAFNPDNLNLSPAEYLRHIQYQFGGLKLGYKFIHYEGNSFPISGSRATIDTGAAAQSRVSLTRVVGGSLFGPTGALI